jgi:predicted transcriptional regulator of viral defense system
MARHLPAAPRLPSNRSSIEGWVRALAAHGHHAFTVDEAHRALGGTLQRVRVGLSRLAAKGLLIRPVKGLYVIVPPEYQAAGAPPPLSYIDTLMRHVGLPYYVGLLSAAALHGADAQAAQELQVITTRPLPMKELGRGRIRWIVKHSIDDDAVQEMTTRTGTVRVSTPEATALDLVRYNRYAGYLDHVATVLADLAEHLDADRLATVARHDRAAARRLGYLLEQIGCESLATAFGARLNVGRPHRLVLDRHAPTQTGPLNNAWGLQINTTVHAE